MGKKRGGAREGAGRRRGARNKRTIEIIAAAQATGKLPHEILLQIAQSGTIEHHGKEVKLDLHTRIACCESVAPYYAPKIAQIQQKIEGSTAFVIGSDPLSEEEFERKYGLGMEPAAKAENPS